MSHLPVAAAQAREADRDLEVRRWITPMGNRYDAGRSRFYSWPLLCCSGHSPRRFSRRTATRWNCDATRKIDKRPMCHDRLLTLVLLASAQQRVQAGHVILYTGLGAAAGAVVVWLIQRSGDDPPTPSTQDPPTALRSTSWRPLPAMAQEAFEKHFGAGFPPSTHRDPRPIECLTSRGVEARWPACGSRELRGVQGAFSRPGR